MSEFKYEDKALSDAIASGHVAAPAPEKPGTAPDKEQETKPAGKPVLSK